jgi:hypothetical protein
MTSRLAVFTTQIGTVSETLIRPVVNVAKLSIDSKSMGIIRPAAKVATFGVGGKEAERRLVQNPVARLTKPAWQFI